MGKSKFQGDKKLPFKSPLASLERKLIDATTPHFPKWIEGYHLTLTTILWSVGVVFAGYMAQQDLRWLWLSSGMIFMQWFSDSWDGSLGRYRGTGIPKWGFYMDHFLDYIFMCAFLVGYAFLLTGKSSILVLLLIPLFGAFMVNSYLSFAATNEFKITFLGIGPTEVRLAMIILNCFLIWFGTDFLEKSIPYVFPVAVAALCVVVYRTQKYIWAIDMKEKRGRSS